MPDYGAASGRATAAITAGKETVGMNETYQLALTVFTQGDRVCRVTPKVPQRPRVEVADHDADWSAVRDALQVLQLAYLDRPARTGV